MLVVLVARIVAVFTLNVNWDEFALLDRAVTTVRTGDLVTGGRPGLGTLTLAPIAASCQNAVDAVVQGRMLWTVVVLAAVTAFWFLLRAVLPEGPHRRTALVAAVVLWVLTIPFLRASIQVRTDQPAIMFGLLGGIALLASRRAAPWAIVSGLLFGVGFLFTQKLLYVGGLVAVLAVGQLRIHDDLRLRREAIRTALTGAAFLLVVLGYRAVTARLSVAPHLLPVAGGLAAFEQYHDHVGWAYYRAMLPLLLPHGIAIISLFVLTAERILAARRPGAELMTAWVVVALGLAVMIFHAARFPYFFMVLGLFPAAVGGLVVGPVLDRLGTPGRRAVFLAVLLLPFAGAGTVYALTLTAPTLQHQRASLAFVERNFAREARGFEARGAFACRDDPDPFPVHFLGAVRQQFAGEDRLQRIRDMAGEFRSRPVAFMIPPTGHGYPPELWAFWNTRYVHYHGAVHVPGRTIVGGSGWSGDFEVIVPGRYVWRTGEEVAGALEVGGRRVVPGATILLNDPGYASLRLPDGGEGILVLSLPDAPATDTTSFYVGL